MKATLCRPLLALRRPTSLCLALSAILCLSLAGHNLHGAELVTLSPDNYAAYAPRADLTGAFFGDYVMRNDKVSVCIADPFLLSGRSASRWAIGKVGGAIIALTPRDTPAAASPTAYYPGPLRFKPDAPAFRDEFDAEAANPPWNRPERTTQTGDEVTLEIGAYEIASGKALAELAKLPPHLRGAPKPAVNIIYKLRQGEPFVRVLATYTNPTATLYTHAPATIMRTDGDWERGADADNRAFWVYDRKTLAACVVMADNHTLAVRTVGAQSHLSQRKDDRDTLTLPPGGSATLETRLFPSADLAEARRLLLELRGISDRTVHVAASMGEAAAHGVTVTATSAGRIIGAGRCDPEGQLTLHVPASAEVTLTASAPGLAELQKTVAAGADAANITFALPKPSTISATICDDHGQPMPHKMLVYNVDAPPRPDGPYPLAIWGGADGQAATPLAPGRYRLIFSAGAEYDCVEEAIALAPGEARQLDITLRRSVATPGWISAETHNHSGRSGASEIYYVYPYQPNTTTDGGSTEPVADKVASLAAEHIEFAPATEHNFAFSYADKIAALGLGDFIATAPGIGLTAGRRHTTTHQNTFPVPYVKGAQDGGAKQREEHIGQLEWLTKWDGHEARVIQIVVPRNDDLVVSSDMHVLDVVALEPIVERQPINGLDNRILQWLDRLAQGYRLPAVCNAGRFASRQETGRYRNYIRSASDAPAKIDPLQIAAALRRGEVMMTTGPFMECVVNAAASGASVSGIHETLAAPDGRVIVSVRVQCANWSACDTVQVLAGKEPVATRTRAAHPELFDRDGAAFEAQIALQLTADAPLLVVASGMGRDLHDKRGDPDAKRLHVAVSAPVFVDADGNGYAITSPLLDKVSPVIDFIDPPLALADAAPGRIRVTLVNNSADQTAADTIELLVRPPEAFRFVSPRQQSYNIAPGGEAFVEWLVAFDNGYLRRHYPLRCNYNMVNTFGVRLARSPLSPGRKAGAMWMHIDHRIASLPPLQAMADIDTLLADEPPLSLVINKQQRAGEIRIGISGDNLALLAFVQDTAPQRRAAIIDSSSLELYGANAGRDAKGADAVSGGYYAVKQVYLIPPLGERPAEHFKRLGTNAKIEAAPEIRSAFTATRDGYEVRALVPLRLLGIDIDRVKRTQHMWRSGETDVETIGKQGQAGRFMFEARANLPGAAGATRHATAFGSAAPHVDVSAFGTMRLMGDAACDLAIINPLPVESGQPPALVRLSITNTTANTLQDTVTLTLAPATAGTVENDGIFQFTLPPHQGAHHDFTITPAADLTGAVHLVIPRSPLGIVAGTPSPRLPFGTRAITDLGTVTIDEAIARLAALAPRQALAGAHKVADVRLALAGNDLALMADVTEPQIRQEANAWKGSDIEIFGIRPDRENAKIGQVFLIPGTDRLPPKALRKGDPDVVAAPEIRLTSALTDDGYRLTALIPLTLLRLDGHDGEAALEVQVASLIKGKQSFTTLFGSTRAYLDTSRYGVFKKR